MHHPNLTGLITLVFHSQGPLADLGVKDGQIVVVDLGQSSGLLDTEAPLERRMSGPGPQITW